MSDIIVKEINDLINFESECSSFTMARYNNSFIEDSLIGLKCMRCNLVDGNDIFISIKTFLRVIENLQTVRTAFIGNPIKSIREDKINYISVFNEKVISDCLGKELELLKISMFSFAHNTLVAKRIIQPQSFFPPTPKKLVRYCAMFMFNNTRCDAELYITYKFNLSPTFLLYKN